MITTLQYRTLDRALTEHLNRLTSLHIADARGNHTEELVEKTVESWHNILVCLAQLMTASPNYHLTPEQHVEVLTLVQGVTTRAGIVETLRERRILAEEEGVGKHLKEVIDKKLDAAKESRNTAYQAFHKYMLDLLDYGAEE